MVLNLAKHLVRFTLAALVLSACDDPDATRRALDNMGMTNIEARGYSWWGCDKHDTFATKFAATNPQGKRITGVVCSGWMKGATVRFD